ncbi:MAG: lipopolysaccharide biosynthesis protein [Erysipelotrichaceae bacterium]|nr:lipopolysaccharide biosynthesis protein [Erysipelotrichaceae bacterium]
MDNNQQQINSKTITSNLMWRFLERFGVYIVSFIISVVLARILDPSTYGVVALMTVVITFLDVFVTGGFSNSLIHDKDTTEKDFNTLLIFNISFSIVLYVLLFIISPLIASYYEKEILTWLIRVSGISLLISGVKSLQYAYVAKRLEFKKFFYATIGGTIFSGIIGIVMAVNGLGAWALVVQGVVNHFIDSTILWFVIDWRPTVEFDKKLLKKHFSFGIKILIYKIIYNISNNVRQLVIGKKYSESDLSFYNRGKTYPNMIGQNIYNSVNSVMFPVLAKTQDDKDRFNEILAKSFKINVFVMLPICIGLFSVSESFIHLLIGEKWLPCVPYIKVFCIVVFLNSIEAIFSNGPMALGKSTASMILGIMECVFNIIALIVAIPHGVMAIGYSMIVSSAFNCLIYFIYLKKISNFKVFKCILNSFKTYIASIIMGTIVFFIGTMSLPYYLLLFVQVLIGVALYYLLSKLFRNDALEYCLGLIKKLVKKG